MTSLQQADRRAVQARTSGELFLRHPRPTALAPDVGADPQRDIFGRHLTNPTRHSAKVALPDGGHLIM
jgi:hypothetical protein